MNEPELERTLGTSGSGNFLGERRSGKLHREFGPSESRTRTGTHRRCRPTDVGDQPRGLNHPSGNSSKRSDWLDRCTGTEFWVRPSSLVS